MLLLEELEHAKRRGAMIYAEVLGLGTSFDAYAVTKPDPEARGAARAIRWALREAHVDAGDIDYINAHGTSTRLNDLMETVAVKRVFGSRHGACRCRRSSRWWAISSALPERWKQRPWR